MKIKLNTNEVELAFETSKKRFIGNLKMGKAFSYGYEKGMKGELYDSFLGCLGEIAYAKASNTFFNGSYSDNLERYTDSDFQNNIEVRTQDIKKDRSNFLLIRPGEKHGKYFLVIHNGNYEFNILGSFIFDKPMPERLTDFGYPNRPPAYRININELKPLEENVRQDKF